MSFRGYIMDGSLGSFIKGNPLLAGVIFLALMMGIYYGFSSLYAAGHIMILDKANKELDQKAQKLETEKQTLTELLAGQEAVIEHQTQELEKKDALLQSISTKVVNNKQALDDAVATASRITNNDSPMSREELKAELCRIYNIAPPACR